MEENKKEKGSIDTENLKNETSSTINEVKETIKNVNLKNDTAEAKGLLIEMFKNPIHKIKDIANSNSFLKTAMILIAIWTITSFVDAILGIRSFKTFFEYNFFRNAFSIVKTFIAPALGILVMSVVIIIMNKKAKKSLTTIISTVTIAKIPVIIASVVSLLTAISPEILKITSPFYSLCSIISTILLYFGIKAMYDSEDDNNFIKTFAIVEAIYFVVKLAISYLGIYL